MSLSIKNISPKGIKVLSLSQYGINFLSLRVSSTIAVSANTYVPLSITGTTENTETAISVSNGNILKLKAGYTYLLNMGFRAYHASAAVWASYVWKDLTNNVQLTPTQNAGLSITSSSNSNSYADTPSASCIVTPTTDIDVALVVLNTSASIPSAQAASGGGSAFVVKKADAHKLNNYIGQTSSLSTNGKLVLSIHNGSGPEITNNSIMLKAGKTYVLSSYVKYVTTSNGYLSFGFYNDIESSYIGTFGIASTAGYTQYSSNKAYAIITPSVDTPISIRSQSFTNQNTANTTCDIVEVGRNNASLLSIADGTVFEDDLHVNFIHKDGFNPLVNGKIITDNSYKYLIYGKPSVINNTIDGYLYNTTTGSNTVYTSSISSGYDSNWSSGPELTYITNNASNSYDLRVSPSSVSPATAYNSHSGFVVIRK